MNRYTVTLGGVPYQIDLISKDGAALSFSVDGIEYRVEVSKSRATSSARHLERHTAAPTPAFARGTHSPQIEHAAGTVTAPIPGIVSALKVKLGDTISRGDTVAIIEAMKMENPIRAQNSGVVTGISVQVGDEVPSGSALMTIA